MVPTAVPISFDLVGGSWIQTAKLITANMWDVSLDGNRALVTAGSGAYIFDLVGGSWTQTAQLSVSGPVSLDGDRALVGDYEDGDPEAAYVFDLIGGSWTQTAEIPGWPNDGFASAVSLEGDLALVGVPEDDNLNGIDAGAALVYGLDGGSWTQQAELLAKLPPGPVGYPGEEFGYAVSLSGDTALIGAPYDNTSDFNAGAAYVYVNDGGVWEAEAKLFPDVRSSEDRFGGSLSLDGNRALIAGLGYVNDPYLGPVYVFERNGGIWTKTAQLSIGGRLDIGTEVVLDGDRALVTEYDIVADYSLAHIFEYENGTWTRTAELDNSPGESQDGFGLAAALEGDRVLIGAPTGDGQGGETGIGAAYVFEYENGAWTQTARLVADDGEASALFGDSVALDGNRALISASWDDDQGQNSGSVYVFEYENGVWTQTHKLMANDSAAGDRFGTSVVLEGNRALIGATGDNDRGSDSGSVYLFQYANGTWTQVSKVTADDGAADDRFGNALAIEGDRVLIGANGDDNRQGSAYVFDIDISPGDVPSIVRFELWDADQNWNPSGNGKIRDLGSNETVNLAILEAAGIDNVTVIAVTDPSPTGSVMFDLDGTPYRLENVAPYVLDGDRSGDLRPWNLEAGNTYAIAAVPYSERSQGGVAGPHLETTLTVIDDPVPTNLPPTADAGSGATLTLPTTTVALTGSVSDATPTGTLTAQWVVVSGPAGVTFADDTDPTTTVEFPGLGTYVLRLTADDGAFTDSDEVTFDVVEDGVQPGEIVMQLWDTQTDSLIDPNLSLPITINLAQTPNPTLIAVVDGNPTRVDFKLDNRTVATEGAPPYAIAGDKSATGDLKPWAIAVGQYDLQVVVIEGNSEVDRLQTTLTVVDQTPSIVLQLWDTETDSLIDPNLSLPITINLADTPNPTLIAVVENNPTQVVFKLDGQTVRTEGAAPYAIAGDQVATGDLNPWSITPGQYALEVIVLVGTSEVDKLETALTITD
jgi:hypothetical protein